MGNTAKTRLFFVTDSLEDNEELHETLEKAISYKNTCMNKLHKPRVYIAIVKNAYRFGFRWNYSDHSDTFEIIKIID